MAKPSSVARQQRRIEARKKARRWVRNYVKTHPCVDCGESDWRVIEFDHRDRLFKKAAVADLITQGASLDRIKAEIDKCDTRCANCHRRRTIKQLNWYRA